MGESILLPLKYERCHQVELEVIECVTNCHELSDYVITGHKTSIFK